MRGPMIRKILVLVGVIVLAGCSAQDNGVRVAKDRPAPVPVAPVQARTEPIFYNGKTYTLKFAPVAGGYDVAVLGMTAKQKTDATNIATSAIRYFTCPEGKTGKLTSAPRYEAAAWKMGARCG